MTEQAIVANVVRRVAATSLSTGLLGGEVEIEVEDTDQVPEPPETGLAQIVVAPGDEDSETLTYTRVDDAAGTIVLDPATPVVNPWDPGTDIQIAPAIMDHDVMCYLPGAEGDPLVAHLPHALEPLLPEGTRVDGEGETILVAQRDLEWIVTDVLGQGPTIRSGLLSWGGVTDDLVGAGFDLDGEQVGELSAENPGFARLYVGDLTSPTVPTFGTDDLTFWVDPDDGDDTFDGSVLFPLASIAEALSRVPTFNGGEVVINLVSGSVLSEAIDIESFSGAGSITIDGQATSTVISGTFALDGCSMDVVLKNVTLDDDSAAGDVFSQAGLAESSIFCRNSRLLTIDNVLIYSHGAKAENLFVQAANVQVQNSTEFHGSTNQCVKAGATAQVTLANTKGSSAGGVAVLVIGSAVRIGGTRMAGTFTQTFGGRVVDDSTSTVTGGASGGGTRSTRYWSATQTGSWRDAFGGGFRSDNDDVYQGEYFGNGNHRGCWFYDYADIQTRLDGRHIDAAYLFVRRRAAGGVSGGVPLQLWTHDRASKSGVPGLSNPAVIGSMAWGGGRWIKIPNSFAERLRDGTGGAKGLALYRADGSAYGIFTGRSGFGASGRLKITSH